MNNDLCVMVVSCDAYSDAWPTFEECFSKFWPDCPFTCYFVSNEKKETIHNFKTICTGPEISWSAQVRDALNKIPEDYLLFLLEDYFIVEKIDTGRIEEDLKFLMKHHSGYLSYFPVKEVMATERKGIGLISENNVYGKVLQPSIWNREYLLQCLGKDDYSAWEFENRQKISSKTRVFGTDYCTTEFPIKWKNGIIQGKWFPPTIDYLNKIGIKVDTASREVLTWGKTKKYQMRSKFYGFFSVKTIKKYKRYLKKLGIRFVTED